MALQYTAVRMTASDCSHRRSATPAAATYHRRIGAYVIFIRAANVGGSGVFSTAALARKLDLVNIGAAGTFVARKRTSRADIAKEIPFALDLAICPAAEVLRLVDAGAPRTAGGAKVFVSVLVAPATVSPRLPLELPAKIAAQLQSSSSR